MEKTLEEVEDPLQEWELLPDNTPFFQLGLHEIPDIISNEIIYADYFIQTPNLLPQTPSHRQDEQPQLKNIAVSHIFFNTINQHPDQHLIDSASSRSDQPKNSAVEIEIQIEIEKVGCGEKVDLEEEKEVWDGMWMLRWRVMGVGALVTIGAAAAAAAATICVVVLGGGGREGKQAPRRRRRERNVVRFFSHDEDKGVNRVVEQASRLNQALAAARGTPTMMRAAKISFGGCYDGL